MSGRGYPISITVFMFINMLPVFLLPSLYLKIFLNNGIPAVEKYKEFLSSGSSDYSLELLKKVGVDLTNQTYRRSLEVFEKHLDEYETLI